jgi:predicted RNA binding protein YcfA (HicA-like mRNA interferase family)
MTNLPVIESSEMLRALHRAHFYVHHQTGSHVRLFHKERLELKVTLPVHNKDLPEKTLKSILKQADLTVEELIDLLKG